MLKKLIRYEFQATARIFLPLYGAFLAMSLLLRLVMTVQEAQNWQGAELPAWLNLLLAIPVLLYVALFIATVVMTFVVAVYRFYKNLMTEEGYLMFTLPVKPIQLMNSKLIAALVWTVLSALVCLLSLMILIFTPDLPGAIAYWWQIFVTGAASEGLYLTTGILVELIVAVLVSCAGFFVQAYTAVAATNFSDSHKGLMGVGAYLVINFASQMIFSILLFIGGMTLYPQIESMLNNSQDLMWLFHLTIWGSVAWTVAISAVLYAGTHWILKKKLNLN